MKEEEIKYDTQGRKNNTPVWYWGRAHVQLVARAMVDVLDGSFCVFYDKEPEYHTLAYKVTADDIRYVEILCRDHLYGFTEPLSFESLPEALDAYNGSPTETGNSLKIPLPKPVIPQPTIQPVPLLRRLRHLSGLLVDREHELEEMMECIERLEKHMEERGRQIEAYSAVEKMLTNQRDKSNRLSIGHHEHPESSECLVENSKVLQDRLEDTKNKLADLRKMQQSDDVEKNQLSSEHTKRFQNFQDLIDEIEVLKKQLIEIALYNDNVDCIQLFMDSLLTGTKRAGENVKVHVISNKDAKKILEKQPEGTYLMRHKTRPTKLNSSQLMVSYRDLSGNPKVAEYQVIHINSYYGFEPDTCIFDSINDLVTCYTRIPFCVHTKQYGDLILRQQYIVS